MKIGILGTQCIGKTTFIQDFIKNWNTYTSQDISYRDLIKEKNLDVNQQGNKESQKIILDSLCDAVINTPEDSNVLFDRTVLDNLVYTLWLNAHGKVDNSFVKETIDIVRETMIFYDVLFFMPITKHSPIVFESAENRSEDKSFREEIDFIFKSLAQRYNTQDKTYFPFDHKLGCPALVEIFGNREERIQLTKMYINPDGNPFGEDESLLKPDDLTEDDIIDNPTLLDFQ